MLVRRLFQFDMVRGKTNEHLKQSTRIWFFLVIVWGGPNVGSSGKANEVACIDVKISSMMIYGLTFLIHLFILRGQ